MMRLSAPRMRTAVVRNETLLKGLPAHLHHCYMHDARNVTKLISSQNRRNTVIIGGGIIGASIAFYLSKRGVASTIIERSSVAAAASGDEVGWGGDDHGRIIDQHRMSVHR